MSTKIKTEIFYYTGYTLHVFLNHFEKLLNEYEQDKNEDFEEVPLIYKIDVLYNLIKITNNFLNLKPYEIKLICHKLLID